MELIYINDFLKFISESFVIFEPNVELDEIYSIQDNDRLFKYISFQNVKKLDHKIYLNILTNIFSKLRCFHLIDIDFSSQLSPNDVDNVFCQYQQYKLIDNNENFSCNHNIDTSHTIYLETTNLNTKHLISKFGNLIKTGSENDKWRYEFKFTLNLKDKQHIFSLYDYKNTNEEFDSEENISWHLAGNTKCKKIRKRIVNILLK